MYYFHRLIIFWQSLSPIESLRCQLYTEPLKYQEFAVGKESDSEKDIKDKSLGAC